ncbi:hypothetical protein RhiJN_20184 [Ceratobasidium sp. AG-Ba]|nr:hypothetical protein RhiJN_20184 [Ceratobasidium sp. AG-Ba]
MAPIHTNKSAQTSSVRYNPRNARVVSINVPNGNKLYSYQDAIKCCDSFIRSSDYAKSLDPSLTLDYIPMGKRWNCKWHATHTLQCPKRGNLYWVGKGPQPELSNAMQATKLFVIEEWVGSEVKHLVKEVQKLSDIEEMKEKWEKEVQGQGPKMAIIAKVVQEWCAALDVSKSYQEVLKEITFGENAWDKGNNDLVVDMADLLLEPLNKDEEWLKLTEEAWSAEAPNGSNNVKSHLLPADF